MIPQFGWILDRAGSGGQLRPFKKVSQIEICDLSAYTQRSARLLWV